MKTYVIASALLTSVAFNAHAADVVPTSEYINETVSQAHDWSGGYWGIHGGYVYARDRKHEYDSPTDDYGTHNTSFNGFNAGLLFGYNVQEGDLVKGIEFDFGYAFSTDNYPLVATPVGSKLNWNGHLRGRLGKAIDEKNFFVAGGLAFANRSVQLIPVSLSPVVENDTMFWGVSVGAGVDIATQKGSNVRLEYLFDFYPEQEAYDGTDVGATVGWPVVDSRLSTHTIRLAVTF